MQYIIFQHLFIYNGREIILRFYEAAGAAVDAEIDLHLPAEKIWECNMLEEEEKELWERKEDSPCLHLTFRAFEIKTLRLHR